MRYVTRFVTGDTCTYRLCKWHLTLLSLHQLTSYSVDFLVYRKRHLSGDITWVPEHDDNEAHQIWIGKVWVHFIKMY